jgi:SpoVK/Ycf46/Vps4 family AAA+-type ATPase
VQSTDNVERVVSTMAWLAAHSARLTSPALLVIDDVDALLPSRLDEATPTTELRVGATAVRELRRLQSTCLRHGGILLLLSARPDHLPQDFLACGDLEAHAFEMAAPNEAQRSDILGRLCHGLQGPRTRELHRLLVIRTQGYQPADLANVVREAILASWNETRLSSTPAPEVSSAAVERALRRCRPAALAGLQSAASDPVSRPWPPIHGCAHVIRRLEDFILNPLRSFTTLSAQGAFL